MVTSGDAYNKRGTIKVSKVRSFWQRQNSKGWVPTKAGDKIVECCENGSFPAKFGGECAIKCDGWSNGEDGKGEIVEFLPPIVQSDGGEWLGTFERVVYIIVWNVEISWKLGRSAVIINGDSTRG